MEDWFSEWWPPRTEPRSGYRFVPGWKIGFLEGGLHELSHCKSEASSGYRFVPGWKIDFLDGDLHELSLAVATGLYLDGRLVF
jgi:hypothetical protein